MSSILVTALAIAKAIVVGLVTIVVPWLLVGILVAVTVGMIWLPTLVVIAKAWTWAATRGLLKIAAILACVLLVLRMLGLPSVMIVPIVGGVIFGVPTLLFMLIALAQLTVAVAKELRGRWRLWRQRRASRIP
jgi:hypothetical protein